MADDVVAIAVVHVDTEAVMRAAAVFEFYFFEHFFVALGLEERLGDEALIPEGKIVGRHGKLAGGEHPSCAFFGCGTQRGRGRGDSRVWRREGDELGLVRVPDGVHAERMENALGEEVKEELAGNLLDDGAGDDVVGV